MYIPATGLEEKKLPPFEFKQDSPNQVLARKTGEIECGKGGQLFAEIPPSISPWINEENKSK